MIDSELLAKLDAIEAKAERAYRAAETVRAYLFWTGVVTAALVVLPIIGLAFAIPQYIDTYTTPMNGIGY